MDRGGQEPSKTTRWHKATPTKQEEGGKPISCSKSKPKVRDSLTCHWYTGTISDKRNTVSYAHSGAVLQGNRVQFHLLLYGEA